MEPEQRNMFAYVCEWNFVWEATPAHNGSTIVDIHFQKICWSPPAWLTFIIWNTKQVDIVSANDQLTQVVLLRTSFISSH